MTTKKKDVKHMKVLSYNIYGAKETKSPIPELENRKSLVEWKFCDILSIDNLN